MKVLVTGGAGFIGSNLVDRLLDHGATVTVYDNFSTGQPAFLDKARTRAACHLVEADLLDRPSLTSAMRGQELVVHLAANADVRHGLELPHRDLEQNTIATHHLLEAMRACGTRRIVFSSTGSVYGEPAVFPTPEDCPLPIQTSLYGASKIAAEGLISAYSTGFGIQAIILRFVSILGERYTHGHVFDFYRKLRANPDDVEILGDGNQRKSYLYVGDCLDALLRAVECATAPVSIFNLGSDEYCTVNDSLGWICAALGVNPRRHFTGGERGWVGDSPFIFLDCTRIRALGWRPTLTIREAVLRTLEYLQASPWVMEQRA